MSCHVRPCRVVFVSCRVRSCHLFSCHLRFVFSHPVVFFLLVLCPLFLSKGKDLPRKGLIKSCHGKGMRKQRPQVRKRA